MRGREGEKRGREEGEEGARGGRRGGGRREKRGREEGEGRKKGRERKRGNFCARESRDAPEGRRETRGREGGGKGAGGGEAYPLSTPSNRVLRDLKLDICICDFHFFVNKRVPDDICESAFKFLVRNGCIKGRLSIPGKDRYQVSCQLFIYHISRLA